MQPQPLSPPFCASAFQTHHLPGSFNSATPTALPHVPSATVLIQTLSPSCLDVCKSLCPPTAPPSGGCLLSTPFQPAFCSCFPAYRVPPTGSPELTAPQPKPMAYDSRLFTFWTQSYFKISFPTAALHAGFPLAQEFSNIPDHTTYSDRVLKCRFPGPPTQDQMRQNLQGITGTSQLNAQKGRIFWE